VIHGEGFILEAFAVDGLATGTISSGKVTLDIYVSLEQSGHRQRSKHTTLNHESLDDAVEGAAGKVQRLASLSDSLLPSAESAEVLCRSWDRVCVELEDDSPGRLTTDGDVEVTAWTSHGMYGGRVDV